MGEPDPVPTLSGPLVTEAHDSMAAGDLLAEAARVLGCIPGDHAVDAGRALHKGGHLGGDRGWNGAGERVRAHAGASTAQRASNARSDAAVLVGDRDDVALGFALDS